MRKKFKPHLYLGKSWTDDQGKCEVWFARGAVDIFAGFSPLGAWKEWAASDLEHAYQREYRRAKVKA